ncbi:Zinc finger RING-CH-type [Arabidopsis suecica]|uniref:Zinc finger RING-CH-type n=1 Tax=Arabidopsis suecica TaxID=45249 RepID=A0A8T2AK81_ARASU|nr:Zinc finger RING-CH-type [Arabidopsis suecica]
MTDIDLEQGGAFGYHHRRSLDGSDDSVYYSEGEDVTSCYSYFYSTTGGSYEYEGDQSRKVSSVMSPSSEIDDDDDDDDASAPPEKDCRICHMGVETSGGGGIELGCSCKEDLAVAHRQCAETWFKIKGDKICEICQSVARNVGGANEMVGSTMEERELRNGEETAAGGGGGATVVENRWQPQRVVNLVLACMVFGFFISWIFHFHVSSSS